MIRHLLSRPGVTPVAAGVLLLVLAAGAARYDPLSRVLLTADQRGQLLYRKGDFAGAAETFTDPRRRGAALFRTGDFKQAAALFSGFDTAEGAYNHGNALVMQGLYEDAIPRYQRALQLRPGWSDAEINLAIAQEGAERLKKTGGDMTGGQMGADEITFTKGDPPQPDAGEEVVETPIPLDEASKRALWLRKVQTQPADFLRSKFAYQAAAMEESAP